LKGYKIWVQYSRTIGFLICNWVSHMGLTKTMPEFGNFPFHKPGKNGET
jgi:hypothetical protein